MNCPSCRAALVPGAKFCDICGTVVSSRTPGPPRPGGYAPRPAGGGRVQAAENSGLAVASMVLGIVGVVFIWLPVLSLIGIPAAIVAVVLGPISLGPINRGEKSGRGFALTGLITGIVTLGVFLIFLLLIGSITSSSWRFTDW